MTLSVADVILVSYVGLSVRVKEWAEPSLLAITAVGLAFRQECLDLEQAQLLPRLRLAGLLLTTASSAVTRGYSTSAEADLYKLMEIEGYNFECSSTSD